MLNSVISNAFEPKHTFNTLVAEANEPYHGTIVRSDGGTRKCW